MCSWSTFQLNRKARERKAPICNFKGISIPFLQPVFEMANFCSPFVSFYFSVFLPPYILNTSHYHHHCFKLPCFWEAAASPLPPVSPWASEVLPGFFCNIMQLCNLMSHQKIPSALLLPLHGTHLTVCRDSANSFFNLNAYYWGEEMLRSMECIKKT